MGTFPHRFEARRLGSHYNPNAPRGSCLLHGRRLPSRADSSAPGARVTVRGLVATNRRRRTTCPRPSQLALADTAPEMFPISAAFEVESSRPTDATRAAGEVQKPVQRAGLTGIARGVPPQSIFSLLSCTGAARQRCAGFPVRVLSTATQTRARRTTGPRIRSPERFLYALLSAGAYSAWSRFSPRPPDWMISLTMPFSSNTYVARRAIPTCSLKQP